MEWFMEWYFEDPRRLTVVAFLIAATILLVFRKQLLWAIPCMLIWLLFAVAVVPTIIRNQTHSAANSCINNLRQLDGAKQQWQIENKKTTNDIPTLNDMKGYVKLNSSNEIPACPQGGIYILGRLDEPTRCSIGGQSHSLP